MGKKIENLLREFSGQDNLIPALQAVQADRGYLSAESLEAVAHHFRVPASTVFGIASFYTQFYLTRQGKHRIRVCCGTACHVLGGQAIMRAVEKYLGIKPGQTTPDYQFSFEQVACVGSCALGPVVVINDHVHGKMTPKKTINMLAEL